MKTATYPWNEVERPGDPDGLNTRRADAAATWDYWWGRDHLGQAVFLVSAETPEPEKPRIPLLKAIDVKLVPVDGNWGIRYTLLDAEVSEQFHDLCLKLMEHCEGHVKNTDQLIPLAISRTWLWHRLLAGGKKSAFSQRDQMGLLAELLVLRDRMIPELGAAAAVECWTGPEGEARDFLVGDTAVEVKATSARDRGRVRVSSLDQLSLEDLGSLFLAVQMINSAPGAGLLDIPGVVESVRKQLIEVDSGVIDRFNGLLLAAGFDESQDQEYLKFDEGEMVIYGVIEDFPRLDRVGVSPSIDAVRYSIQLDDCARFRISDDDLRKALKPGKGQHRGQ